MKGETEIILVGGIVAAIAVWKISGGVSQAIQDTGKGLGNAFAGAGQGFTNVGSGFQALGGGIGQGVTNLGTGFEYLGAGLGSGFSGLGQGIGGGVFQIGTGIQAIGEGTGYALGGANPTDLLRTTLTLGKSYYTDKNGNTFYNGQLVTNTNPTPQNVVETPSISQKLKQDSGSSSSSTSGNLLITAINAAGFGQVYDFVANTSSSTKQTSQPTPVSSGGSSQSFTNAIKKVYPTIAPSTNPLKEALRKIGF